MLRRRIRHRNNQIINRALILILTALTSSSHPLPEVSGGGIKLTHSKLSSLGRQQERVSSSSGSNAGGSSGINSVNGASASDGISASGGMTVPGNSVAAGGGEILVPKSYPLSAQEPTCEELRAMWIFSKRQSRAAEITNEIPTYRDPFAYNVWDPYYSTTRSLGGLRMVPRYAERSRSPVFGRIISREPILGYDNPRLPIRPRHLSDLQSPAVSSGPASQVFGSEAKPSHSLASPRRQMQYRFSGGSTIGMGRSAVPVGGANANSVAVQGSFQKLKELIWTERARELTKQRRTEELAARAAVLKEIAKGQNFQSIHKHLQKSESPLMDKNRNPDQEIYQNAADPRLSISDGQSVSGIQSAMHDSGSGYNLALRGSKVHKPVFLSGSPSTKSLRPSRFLQPNMMASSIGRVDDSFERMAGGGKAFPLRPSHFRERNRSLFKEPPKQRDYFRRFQRFPMIMDSLPQSNTTLDQVLGFLNQEVPKNYDEELRDGRELDNALLELHQESRPTKAQQAVWNTLSTYLKRIDPDSTYRAPNQNYDMTLPASDVEEN